MSRLGPAEKQLACWQMLVDTTSRLWAVYVCSYQWFCVPENAAWCCCTSSLCRVVTSHMDACPGAPLGQVAAGLSRPSGKGTVLMHSVHKGKFNSTMLDSVDTGTVWGTHTHKMCHAVAQPVNMQVANVQVLLRCIGTSALQWCPRGASEQHDNST